MAEAGSGGVAELQNLLGRNEEKYVMKLGDGWDRRDLVLIAIKVCQIFEALRNFKTQNGSTLVVGDVHDGNILVDISKPPKSIKKWRKVWFVDSDSFASINVNGECMYPAEFGRNEFQHPAKLFNPNSLSQNDDLYGLAVVLFKLLTTGIMPYTCECQFNEKQFDYLDSRKAKHFFPEIPCWPSTTAKNRWEQLTPRLRIAFRAVFFENKLHPPKSWLVLLRELMQFLNHPSLSHDSRKLGKSFDRSPEPLGRDIVDANDE